MRPAASAASILRDTCLPAIACVLLLAACSAPAAPPKPAASAAQPDGDAAERRRIEIHRELAHLGPHPWAGDYYEGDGLGANIALSLAPQAGVAVTWEGCLGLYGANRGRVEARDGMLRFVYETPNVPGFGGFPDAVRTVRWGERRYLIPDAKLIAFVNAVHRGFEPRRDMHGMFLLADGDEKKPASGLPTLSPRFLALLRRQSLEAQVRSVDHAESRRERMASLGCNHVYRLTLDRGANDRLAPGMELMALPPAPAGTTATVLEVAPDSATVKVVGLFEDCSKPKTVPVVGWRFGTGAYDPAKASR
ncbi:MAG: hypothetical protein ACTHOH_01005 [Lysobacteraceae bacterium]